jgi:hypothetical protein
MTDNKQKPTAKGKALLPVKAGTLKLPKKLKAALQHFILTNEKASNARADIFKLFDLALQSDGLELLSKNERADLFFTIRQLIALSDAVFKNKNIIFNH